jgi:uncharacterized protein DUF4128
MTDPVGDEAKILALLVARLKALTLTPALPIAWQNSKFDTPAGNYLRAFILWNRNVNQFVANNSTTQYRGLLQVNLVAMIGTGLIEPTNICGAIAAHLERSNPMVGDDLTVRIEGKPYLSPAVGGPADRTVFPVTASYYAFN